MQIQHNHLVCVPKEAQFLVGHLGCEVMNRGHLPYHTFQFVCVVLYLRICGLYGLEGVGLRAQFFLLVLEIFDSIRQIRPLDLLAPKIVQLMRRLHYGVPAKLYQTYVFLNLFLLFQDVGLFYLHCLSILHFHLGFLVEQLPDNLIKIVINLGHHFEFALF